jgi:hypothetical protein
MTLTKRQKQMTEKVGEAIAFLTFTGGRWPMTLVILRALWKRNWLALVTAILYKSYSAASLALLRDQMKKLDTERAAAVAKSMSAESFFHPAWNPDPRGQE